MTGASSTKTNFVLKHRPDRTKANMRANTWDKMKDWLLHGAIETDEKMAADLAGAGYHINRSNRARSKSPHH
jgi:hypothetical protein